MEYIFIGLSAAAAAFAYRMIQQRLLMRDVGERTQTASQISTRFGLPFQSSLDFPIPAPPQLPSEEGYGKSRSGDSGAGVSRQASAPQAVRAPPQASR